MWYSNYRRSGSAPIGRMSPKRRVYVCSTFGPCETAEPQYDSECWIHQVQEPHSPVPQRTLRNTTLHPCKRSIYLPFSTVPRSSPLEGVSRATIAQLDQLARQVLILQVVHVSLGNLCEKYGQEKKISSFLLVLGAADTRCVQEVLSTVSVWDSRLSCAFEVNRRWIYIGSLRT